VWRAVVLTQDQRHIGFAGAQQSFHFAHAGEPEEIKVFVGLYAGDEVARIIVVAVYYGDGPDTGDLGRYGKSEKQQQHHRHQQGDEHGARVAQDMQRLFSDHCSEYSVHSHSPLVAAAATVRNTSSIVSTSYLCLSACGASRAAMRPSTMIDTRRQYSASSR